MRLRACSFGRARGGEAARNVKRLRGAKFNCEPLPAPVRVGAAAGGAGVAGPERRRRSDPD